MPHISIKLTQSPQTVTLNFGGNHASRVRLLQYGITGLPGPASVFFEISGGGQPVTPMISNYGSTRFPLGVDLGLSSFQDLSHPIWITQGDNMWNDGHQLTFRVFDFFDNEIQFATLFLLFEYDEVDPRTIHAFKPNHVERKHVQETVGRNVIPLPLPYAYPFINTDQNTSYPYNV